MTKGTSTEAAKDAAADAEMAALKFVRPKLLDILKEKGAVGVWCTAFRSGWQAALRSPADAQTPVGVEAVAWRVRFVWLNNRQQYERTNWRYERTREDAEELAAEADDDQGSEIEPLFSAADMARVMGERDELQFAFDAGWAADKRAIERWQQETGRDLVWPDRADLGVWLLNRLEAAEKETAALREALVWLADVPPVPADGEAGDPEVIAEITDHLDTEPVHFQETVRRARAALTQGGTDGR